MKVYIVFKLGSYDEQDEIVGAYASLSSARSRAKKISGRYESCTVGADRRFKEEIKKLKADQTLAAKYRAEAERAPREPVYTPQQFSAYLEAHTTSTCSCPPVVEWILSQDQKHRTAPASGSGA